MSLSTLYMMWDKAGNKQNQRRWNNYRITGISKDVRKHLSLKTRISLNRKTVWSVQFSSVAQSCPTLCDPMDRNTSGLPSITNSQSLPKLVSIESVMPSNHLILCRPLLLPPSIFPSIRVFQMSQLFKSGGQNIGISTSTSVLPMNIQDWSPLGWTGWISLLSKGLSRVFSNTTVQKHQFFGTQLSLQSNSHIHTRLLEKWTRTDKWDRCAFVLGCSKRQEAPTPTGRLTSQILA